MADGQKHVPLSCAGLRGNSGWHFPVVLGKAAAKPVLGRAFDEKLAFSLAGHDFVRFFRKKTVGICGRMCYASCRERVCLFLAEYDKAAETVM